MEVAILAIIFGSIFGVFYLFFSTRHKERLALIEKGADANIFKMDRRMATPTWKVIVINLAFLLMGIGAGVLIGSFLDTYTRLEDGAAYTSMIFLMAGTGLYLGYTQTRKAVD